MTLHYNMKLHCDKSTISISHNKIDRTKHTEMFQHFIKKKLGNSFTATE